MRTPLHIAAFQDRASSVYELINENANVEALDQVAGKRGLEKSMGCWHFIALIFMRGVRG
jgi:hypothetical protein